MVGIMFGGEVSQRTIDVTIENSGNIYGFAGTAGAAGPNAGNAGGAGGTGGDAISVNSGISSGVTITNNSGANIKGGGGGGGCCGGGGGEGGTTAAGLAGVVCGGGCPMPD